MTKRQEEELAKLIIDIGKLTLGSLVLSFFQIKSEPLIVLAIVVIGLTASSGLFIIGLRLFKEIK